MSGRRSDAFRFRSAEAPGGHRRQRQLCIPDPDIGNLAVTRRILTATRVDLRLPSVRLVQHLPLPALGWTTPAGPDGEGINLPMTSRTTPWASTARRRRFGIAAAASAGLLATVIPAAFAADASASTTAAAAQAEALATTGAVAAARTADTDDLQLLAINDFHGNLEPPTGSSGVIAEKNAAGATVSTPAGGAAYLATALRDARVGHKHSLTVAAGDIIGASPLTSALFHDEPTIEAMNKMGLDVTSVGNHEFDEGAAELVRMQKGGCHPVDGCYVDGRKFKGAKFEYLASNVTYADTGKTVLPPYWIKTVHGSKVGFIGATLKGTANIITAEAAKGLEFKGEVETINKYAAELESQGVKSIVALVHEGGYPVDTSSYDADCDAKGPGSGISGAIVDIAKQLDPEIDAVVTGHTHTAYVCTVTDPAGQPRLVTSAASYGRLYTEINLKIDSATHDIVRSSVTGSNRIVRRTVAPAADITSLIDYYKSIAAPIAGRPVGRIAADITGVGSSGTETALGDLIADAQLASTSSPTTGGAQLALMNPGGIRADLVRAQSGTEGDGVVTYAEAFAVQPFTNLVDVVDLTGAQIVTALQQQVSGANLASPKILQVSEGFTYSLDMSRTGADRVLADSVRLGGVPLDPNATYRVAMNNFLAGGGDGFSVLAKGGNIFVGANDLDAFTSYLTANSSEAAPYPVPLRNRITFVG
jgi:5'-nucleotidase